MKNLFLIMICLITMLISSCEKEPMQTLVVPINDTVITVDTVPGDVISYDVFYTLRSNYPEMSMWSYKYANTANYNIFDYFICNYNLDTIIRYDTVLNESPYNWLWYNLSIVQHDPSPDKFCSVDLKLIKYTQSIITTNYFIKDSLINSVPVDTIITTSIKEETQNITTANYITFGWKHCTFVEYFPE